MNYFDKPKILGIIIIALFLLNLGTLSFMWFNRPKPPHPEMIHDMPPDMHREKPADFLIRELKFTDAQQKDYQKLIDEHRMQQKDIHEQLRKTRDEMFSMLSNDNPDSVKAGQLAVKIGELERQVQAATFTHFTKVRAMCDETQKKKFDEVIGDVLKMMTPETGHDRPGMPPPGAPDRKGTPPR